MQGKLRFRDHEIKVSVNYVRSKFKAGWHCKLHRETKSIIIIIIIILISILIII